MRHIWLALCLMISVQVFAQNKTPVQARDTIARVYKLDAQTIGSVGSAGQIRAGHVLTALSFPAAIATDTTKLAYFNLTSVTTVNDAFATHNLTNSGTVTFTATNILGTASGAASFNGTSQYLKSTNAFFNPGNNQSWATGGWFYSTWTGTQSLIANEASTSDRGFQLLNTSAGLIEYSIASSSASNFDIDATYAHGFTNPSWHHLAISYDYPNKLFNLYVDGKLMGSNSQANTRSVTSSTFTIGALNATPSLFFSGSAQDVFFVTGYALTSHHIAKLVSTKISHNMNLIAKRQDWHFKHQHLGTVGNPYQTLPFVWHDPTDSNSLFVDFSDLDATDKVDIRLYDLQQ